MKKEVLILALVLVGSIFAADIPVLPTGYWGYLTQDGNPIVGAVITVKAGGMIVGASDPSGSDGLYSLNVAWDNPDTGETEGVIAGESITFEYNGGAVKTVAVGAQGDNIRLDIQVSGTRPDSGGSTGSGGPSIIPSSGNAEPASEQDVTQESAQESEPIEEQTQESAQESEKVNPPEVISETDNDPRGIGFVLGVSTAVVFLGLMVFMFIKWGRKPNE